MTATSKVLLTRIGCRYTCNFCHPQRPYENSDYSHQKNLDKILTEIDATPSDCSVFVIGGIDCMEDLDLLFGICEYIRKRRGDEPEIHIQSHCAEYQDEDVVQRSIEHGVDRILVPLYGPTAEIHHRVMTPKPDTRIDEFPQLAAIANCLSSEKIGVTVHTVIAQGNAEHLNETIDVLGSIAEEFDTPVDYRIRPVLLTHGKTEDYLPFADLRPYLRQAHAQLLEMNREKLVLDYRFEGFPFCLFNVVEPRIQNADFPATLRTQYAAFVGDQLPSAERHYSEIDARIPNYRIRVHDRICDRCLLQECCAGFQQIDYESHGIGDLKPIC